jgi:hypothetical protein
MRFYLQKEAQRVWDEQEWTEGERSGMSYLAHHLGLKIDKGVRHE